MNLPYSKLLRWLLLLAFMCVCPLSQAQDAAATYPNKPIKIISPFAPGGATDILARILAQKLGDAWKQTIIVDNKVGGNGLIGVQDVLRSAPDGTTLLMGSVSSLAINTAMMKNPPYDPRRDFTAIAGAYTANHVWLVRPNFPARTFGEFIAYMQKNPGKVNISQASTPVKIQLAALQKMAGVDFVEVPYKTLGPTITDVISGTLDMTLLDTGAGNDVVTVKLEEGQDGAFSLNLKAGDDTSPLTVRDVVERHGGALWFERERARQEAFFRFLLPLAGEAAPLEGLVQRLDTRPSATEKAMAQRLSGTLKTAAEAAASLGISPQAVGMWARRPGAPAVWIWPMISRLALMVRLRSPSISCI